MRKTLTQTFLTRLFEIRKHLYTWVLGLVAMALYEPTALARPQVWNLEIARQHVFVVTTQRTVVHNDSEEMLRLAQERHLARKAAGLRFIGLATLVKRLGEERIQANKKKREDGTPESLLPGFGKWVLKVFMANSGATSQILMIT